MMVRCLVAVCMLSAAVGALAQSVVVPPELWDRPRSAGAVLGEPALKQALGGFLENPTSRLVIRHGAAQEPVLQAEELRSWLIALAVEPQRIALSGDLRPGEALRIEIVTPR